MVFRGRSMLLSILVLFVRYLPRQHLATLLGTRTSSAEAVRDAQSTAEFLSNQKLTMNLNL